MSEQIKNEEQVETGGGKEEQFNEEALAKSIIEKTTTEATKKATEGIMQRFSKMFNFNKEEEHTEQKQAEDTEKQEEEKTFTQQEVNEIMASYKKQFKSKNQEQQEDARLSEQVDPKYLEFVKFQSSQEGFELEKFLTENPQYKAKEKPLNKQTDTSSGAIPLSKQTSGMLQYLMNNFK